jgi:hypothetical protein
MMKEKEEGERVCISVTKPDLGGGSARTQRESPLAIKRRTLRIVDT